MFILGGINPLLSRYNHTLDVTELDAYD